MIPVNFESKIKNVKDILRTQKNIITITNIMSYLILFFIKKSLPLSRWKKPSLVVEEFSSSIVGTSVIKILDYKVMIALSLFLVLLYVVQLIIFKSYHHWSILFVPRFRSSSQNKYNVLHCREDYCMGKYLLGIEHVYYPDGCSHSIILQSYRSHIPTIQSN